MSFLRYWLPVLSYAAFIFYLSHQSEPASHVPRFFAINDKIAHMILYAALGALAYRALRYHGGVARGSAWVVALGLSALYGVTDEVHQLYVPMREADVLDLLADATGAGVGAAVWDWVTTARLAASYQA